MLRFKYSCMWQFWFLPIFIRWRATKFEYFMKLFHLSMIKKSISTTNQVHLIQTHQMHFIKGLFLYVQSLKPSIQKKKNWQKHSKTRTPFRTRTVNIYPPDNLLISNFHSPMINLLPATRSVDQSFFGKLGKGKVSEKSWKQFKRVSGT